MVKSNHPNAETVEVHYAANDTSPVLVAFNPDASTLWKTDYHYFDQNTLKELPVTSIYGGFEQATVADKIARMNYDIQIGAVLGLPGKILAFLASLIAASLPITGFYIWWGKKHKKKYKRIYSKEKSVFEMNVS